MLSVTGRIDTIIDSGGLKIHPEVLEQVFINIAGVDDASFDTLNELRALRPDADLFFITGADAISQIMTWRNAHKLWELANFVGVTDFRDSLEALEAAGYAVVGISPHRRSEELTICSNGVPNVPVRIWLVWVVAIPTNSTASTC